MRRVFIIMLAAMLSTGYKMNPGKRRKLVNPNKSNFGTSRVERGSKKKPLSFIPLSLWSWQESVKAVFSGRVTVVDTYSTSIRGVEMSIPLPSVIALHEYIPMASVQRPAFTRRNVFLRDEYKCQYCGTRERHADLTLDHVVPRCHGGPLNWKNAVTCCKSCNTKKGCQSLDEIKNMGMKLRRPPKEPTIRELNGKAGRMLPRYVHESWRPYLEHLWTDKEKEDGEGATDMV